VKLDVKDQRKSEHKLQHDAQCGWKDPGPLLGTDSCMTIDATWRSNNDRLQCIVTNKKETVLALMFHLSTRRRLSSRVVT
jgi:hypothetical protein